MNVPLPASFNVAVAKPIDSRMTWTGTAENLNQIAVNGANRYPGLFTYVSENKNLYVYQGNDTWEKIVTNNIDAPPIFNSTTIEILPGHNGQILYSENSNQVTATLNIANGPFPDGFNVAICQKGVGVVTFQGNSVNLRNRLNLTQTAGQWAIASILRIGSTADYLLYGDLA